MVAPIFRGEFRITFTNNHWLKKIPRTANCPKKLHVKNEVILWPLTSAKLIVLVAQPISTDGGPPAWAVNKRAELGWPSSRGKGWPAVCKSGPRLWKSIVRKTYELGPLKYHALSKIRTNFSLRTSFTVHKALLTRMTCQNDG